MENFDELQKELVSSLLNRSFEIEEHAEELDFDIHEVEGDSFGVVDEEDRRILLHRDAHFGGSFSAMRDYYRFPEKRGVIEDIDIERIDYLAMVEKRLGRNLAPFLLSGPDAERIAHGQKLYRELSVCSDSLTNAFANLVLHEEEELDIDAKELELFKDHPELLLKLAASDDFRDELAPGYGKAPIDAIRLLGKFKIESSLELLFRLLATADIDEEDILLHTLHQFGDVVLQKAIRQLEAKPLTPYHEKMALLLLRFLPNEQALECAKKLLQEKAMVFSKPGLWLLLALEDLSRVEKQKWYQFFNDQNAPIEFMKIARDVLKS